MRGDIYFRIFRRNRCDRAMVYIGVVAMSKPIFTIRHEPNSLIDYLLVVIISHALFQEIKPGHRIHHGL